MLLAYNLMYNLFKEQEMFTDLSYRKGMASTLNYSQDFICNLDVFRRTFKQHKSYAGQITLARKIENTGSKLR